MDCGHIVTFDFFKFSPYTADESAPGAYVPPVFIPNYDHLRVDDGRISAIEDDNEGLYD